jgi:hypothetical protein
MGLGLQKLNVKWAKTLDCEHIQQHTEDWKVNMNKVKIIHVATKNGSL